MKFTKPAISITDQISLLEGRGLVIADKKKAEKYLHNISYYRLRAYMMPFQNPADPTHQFLPGTTFDQILDLYVFDRELRLLVFDAIERIEIALRTQIIYQMCLAHGAWWYEDASLFVNHKQFTNNLFKLDEEIDRSSEVFIDHYKTKYTQPLRPPAWMSLEVSSMGLLSKMYRNLKMSPAKKAVSDYFLLGHPKVLESWMLTISYIRNMCAHHSRLWNRKLTLQPTLPNVVKAPWINDLNFNHVRLYSFLCCTCYILKVVNPSTHFAKKIADLINQYPTVDIAKMGFTKNWKDEPLWKI